MRRIIFAYALSPSGILGDPTKAAAEMGKACLKLLADRTVELLQKKPAE